MMYLEEQRKDVFLLLVGLENKERKCESKEGEIEKELFPCSVSLQFTNIAWKRDRRKGGR
jgi:hypothetical protein